MLLQKQQYFETSQGKGKRVSPSVDFHILRQILGTGWGLGWGVGYLVFNCFPELHSWV